MKNNIISYPPKVVVEHDLINEVEIMEWLANNFKDSVEIINANSPENNLSIPLFNSILFKVDDFKRHFKLNLQNDYHSKHAIVFLPLVCDYSGNSKINLIAFEENFTGEWEITGKPMILSSKFGFVNGDLEIEDKNIIGVSNPSEFHNELEFKTTLSLSNGKIKLSDLIFTKEPNFFNKGNQLLMVLFKKEILRRIINKNSAKYISLHPIKIQCEVKDKIRGDTISNKEYITFLLIPYENYTQFTSSSSELKSAYYSEAFWDPFWIKWFEGQDKVTNSIS